MMSWETNTGTDITASTRVGHHLLMYRVVVRLGWPLFSDDGEHQVSVDGVLAVHPHAFL